MDKYYLIARDRKTNKFRIIRLSDEWYLDDDRATKSFLKANDLEAIDLVTSSFKNEQQMIERMRQNGYLDYDNPDIFIASKKKSNGKTMIRFEEPIYGKSKSRVRDLRTLAIKSLNGDIKKKSEINGNETKNILDDLISKTYFANDFYDIIVGNDTNISKRLSSLLRDVISYGEVPCFLADSEKFSFKNYREIRNVVEALCRLEELTLNPAEDRIALNDDFVAARNDERIAIVPELSIVLDDDYCEGQLSLFGPLEDYDVSKEVAYEVAQDLKAEQTIESLPKEEKVTIDQMPKIVFQSLREFPSNLFHVGGTKNKREYKFNENNFCFPLTTEEKEQFNSLLTGNLPLYFMNYITHLRQARECSEYGEYHEADELRILADADKSKIEKRFKNRSCIAKAYKWCMLYKKCQQKQEAYLAGDLNLGSDDVDAKIFEKRRH